MERVYINYEPKNNLPTHEAVLPNQIEKGVKALASVVSVTNDTNQNLTPSQKELPRWHFILGHIGFQNLKWLLFTGRLKVQVNPKAVVK